MPDKHEVGGSSPLGPTSRTKLKTNSIKKAKAAFPEAKRRDKILIGGSSPLGPTSERKFAQINNHRPVHKHNYTRVVRKTGFAFANTDRITRKCKTVCSLKTE